MSGGGSQDEGRGALYRHLFGLAAAALVIYGLYWAWTMVPEFLRLPRTYRDELGEWRPTAQQVFAFLRDARLVIEILLAFVALSLLDWIWRRTVGAGDT